MKFNSPLFHKKPRDTLAYGSGDGMVMYLFRAGKFMPA